MFVKSASVQHTLEIDVEVTLVGQKPFLGCVFAPIGQRLSDVLNDGRNFVPVRLSSGKIICVSKHSIVSVLEHKHFEEDRGPSRKRQTAPEQEQAPKFDPYEILRVSPDASLSEIRRAYKKRMKSVHPDTIAALDLDEELARVALHTAQKVNYAYKVILEQREDGHAA